MSVNTASTCPQGFVGRTSSSYVPICPRSTRLPNVTYGRHKAFSIVKLAKDSRAQPKGLPRHNFAANVCQVNNVLRQALPAPFLLRRDGTSMLADPAMGRMRSRAVCNAQSIPLELFQALEDDDGVDLPALAQKYHLLKVLLAAAVLAPAAFLVAVGTSPNARAAAQAAAARSLSSTRTLLRSDAFANSLRKLDEHLTYMDWTRGFMGLDLSDAWDPELWLLFKEAVLQIKPEIFIDRLKEKVFFTDLLVPPNGFSGDMRLSYAKFLELLEADRVKRVVVYGDMRTALVEVPHPFHASVLGHPSTYPHYVDSDLIRVSTLEPDLLAPNDPLQWRARETPEHDMEKLRFYLDLPGDFWASGRLVDYLRQRRERKKAVVLDAESGRLLRPHRVQPKVFEVETELTVLDPRDCWRFAHWALRPGAAQLVVGALNLAIGTRFVYLLLNGLKRVLYRKPLLKSMRQKVNKALKRKESQQSAWERLSQFRAREYMTIDKKTGKKKDTGIRFSDIAGMPRLVLEMRETMRLLKKEPRYAGVGARAPKGIILQGPPGTGKTYMARAMAGEADLPFFSAVGSEFIDMFAGVAAERVKNLYRTARLRAPCIIFIDEIDAIGKSRTYSNDVGALEREYALLELLVQMDGISSLGQPVLTIGATNMAPDLDPALLRPGRFENVYEMGHPDLRDRWEILRYYAKDKALASERVLIAAAKNTKDWSAAALANLMNEAAIFMVRRQLPCIDAPLVEELVEFLKHGTEAPRMPYTPEKERLAVRLAAQAIAYAESAGGGGRGAIERVCLWNRRRADSGRPKIEFADAGEGEGERWREAAGVPLDAYKSGYKLNALEVLPGAPPGPLLLAAARLPPLLAARAAEVAFFGPDAASLAAADDINRAFRIGLKIVGLSELHPSFRGQPPLSHYLSVLKTDPESTEAKEALARRRDALLALLRGSWRRTERLVARRRAAIVQIARELLEAPDEAISGARLVQILESTPLDPDSSFEPLPTDFLEGVKEALAAKGQQWRQTAESPAVSRSCDVEARTTSPAVGEVSSSVSDASGPESRPGETGSPSTLTPTTTGDSTALGAGTSCACPFPYGPVVSDVEALTAVSKHVVGPNLHIVDLIGPQATKEALEEVLRILRNPEAVSRILSSRRWIEQASASFPAAPLDTPALLRPGYGTVARLPYEPGVAGEDETAASGVAYEAMRLLNEERVELLGEKIASGEAMLKTRAEKMAAAAAAVAGPHSGRRQVKLSIEEQFGAPWRQANSDKAKRRARLAQYLLDPEVTSAAVL